MDNDQARFILAAARANGADAADPKVAEALAQAQRDPELARWLAEERAFDAAIMRKLQAKEPPADLRARIVAGAQATRPASRPASRRWWIGIAAAAAVVLLAASALLWRRTVPNLPGSEIATRPPLTDWHQSCLAIFDDPGFALDRMGAEYPPIEAFLLERGTRVLPEVPFIADALGLVGCKALTWRDQPVSFLCFRRGDGELVHLFVVPRGTADESSLASGPARGRVGPFATVSWIQGDLVALVASKMPADQLDALLARTEAQSAATAPLAMIGAR